MLQRLKNICLKQVTRNIHSEMRKNAIQVMILFTGLNIGVEELSFEQCRKRQNDLRILRPCDALNNVVPQRAIKLFW